MSRPSVPTSHLTLAGRRSSRPRRLAPDLLGEGSGRAGPRWDGAWAKGEGAAARSNLTFVRWLV